ncbi:unnamed protein product [Camellia sinensis]
MVASWWDYGYQTTAMAYRTVIVNNTWNNTHIATVGTAMSSPKKAAWEIFNSLDVKYVLVVFGGLIGYPSDDINKFLWMVRIGGGVFPHIKEPDYLITAIPESNVYGQAASNLVAGSNLDGAVRQILDMGGGTWDRDTVVRALRAAYNPERAIEYLYSVSVFTCI